MNKAKPMTNKEYKIGHKVPYVYKLSKDNQHLFYFGATHTNDPQHPQFQEIRDFWVEFKKIASWDNSIVLVEGGRPTTFEDEEATIRKSGERGFTRRLANIDKYNCISPEPSDIFLIQELLKKFSEKEVVLYWFVALAHQWIRTKSEESLPTYLYNSLKHKFSDTVLSTFDVGYDNLQKIYKEIVGRDFTNDNPSFLYSLINPTLDIAITNEVSSYSGNEIRDSYMIQEIEMYWTQGLSIFIVYGSAHAVRQEAVIRDMAFG